MFTSVLLRDKRPIKSSSADWRRRTAFGFVAAALGVPLAFAGGARASAAPIVSRNHPGTVHTIIGRRAFPNLHGLTRPYAAIKFRMSPAVVAGSAAFCNRLYTDNSKPPPPGSIWASSGAQMYCFGPQFNQGSGLVAPHNPSIRPMAFTLNNNVNAANPSEDITQSGVRGYGQSETSSAAIESDVVEAWNDSTGFFAPCPSPNNQEELTGFGFSSNNGASFTDLGGLPNVNCASSVYEGDAGVEAYRARNGNDYFYVTSIFINFAAATSQVDLAACKVNGMGMGAFLTCSQPITVASVPLPRAQPTPGTGFFDKPYVTIDQPRGLLYVSYTDFETGPMNTGNGQVQLAKCNLINPGAPVCNGTAAIVAPEGSCVNQGSYPAADPATGDVYVAHEFNYVSDEFAPCNSLPTQQVTDRIPMGAGASVAQARVNIVSESTAFVPGYNRFPLNDFPRIAISDPFGTVSITWNDTRFRPTGDIVLQSYNLGSGFPLPVQHSSGCTTPSCAKPVRLTNNTTPTFNLLPGLRNAEPDGRIDVSWYDRRRSPTFDRSFTDVYGAFDFSPRITGTPANRRVTTVGTSWNGTSSDIVPNFGDYTDNHLKESGSGPTYTTDSLFIAWSDGRIGEPQPFSARISGL